MKTVWQFIIKPNTILPYDQAIVLLGIYPNLYSHKNLHTDYL